MPNLPPHIREWLEIVGLLVLIVSNIAKIISMQRNTYHWNGLGKAIRVEKIAYVALFAWLLLKPYIGLLDHGVVFAALVAFIVVAELRVIRMVPAVRIWHEREVRE